MYIKVYSKSENALKPLIYKPNFMDLLIAAQNDVRQEAKKRVRIFFFHGHKHYVYTPSMAYVSYIKRKRKVCLSWK